MKKFLCFFLFALTLDAQAQTSVYHPFPDSNAVWTVQSGCNNWSWSCGNFGCSYMSRYELTGDTIINGKKYHRIESYGTVNCSSTCTCFYPQWGEHYIREDSTKKIWKRDLFMNTDTLLYDFNLHVGDTVGNTILTSLTGPVVIQSIDSILIGSTYRNRYNYIHLSFGNDTCTHFLIEGIGGGGGLFSELCGANCFEFGAILLCFKQDNTPLYYLNYSLCPQFPDTSTSCNFTVLASEIKSEQHLLIFPNPASNELRIENAELKIESVEVYDMFGKNLFPSPLVPLSSRIGDERGEVINISSLTPGIYFIRIKTSEENISKKFVKQ